jgi:hypothetical protein
MKIGFIDYYLDEWHANNYPRFFRQWTEGCEIAYAWGKIAKPGGLTSKEWGEKYGVEVLDTIEEVVEKSDALIVLSPDNPEQHLELCRLPLASGKPTYVDKTFAPTLAEAKAIFAMAEESGTPCYSSSALYYADEYVAPRTKPVDMIDSWGPGEFEQYSVHQVEPIVSIIPDAPVRVLSIGTPAYPAILVEFAGGQRAKVAVWRTNGGFAMNIGYKDGTGEHVEANSQFWQGCIQSMAQFFRDHQPPVAHENTLRVISIIEAGKRSMDRGGCWVEIAEL